MSEPDQLVPPPPTPRRDLGSLAIVALLLVGAVVLGWHEMTGGHLLPDDSPAPGFAISKFEGGSVSLAELQGRVVVVNFWASWCPPCRAELPYLVKLGDEYRDRGVTLVAASVDESDVASEVVGEAVRNLPPLAKFAAYASPEMVAHYKVGPVPTSYVLDRHGAIVASTEGAVSESTFKRWIEKALERP